MSFNFGSNNITPFTAQSAYKDASGMGGGGMYFRQQKKDDEEDVFESQDKDEMSIFDDEEEIKEKDIPSDTLFNKLVNWFRVKGKD